MLPSPNPEYHKSYCVKCKKYYAVRNGTQIWETNLGCYSCRKKNDVNVGEGVA